MKAVYLAGPIAGCTDAECRDWRQRAIGNLSPIIGLDPLRRDYRWTEIDRNLAASIVEFDLRDIDDSNALLVFHDRPSVGTAMEVFYAHKERIPVYLVNAAPGPLSPWMLHHVSHVFDDLDAACDAIRKDLLGG